MEKPFEIGLLALIAIEAGAIIYLLAKLDTGIAGVLRLMPAVEMLDRVFAGEEPQRAVRRSRARRPRGAEPEPSINMPFDAANSGRGTFTAPDPNIDAIAEELLRRNGQ